MNEFKNNKENCPFCKTELQGEPIPKKDQELFGATHFSRKIGLYSLERDRTVEYKCPDCKKTWPREWEEKNKSPIEVTKYAHASRETQKLARHWYATYRTAAIKRGEKPPNFDTFYKTRWPEILEKKS